MSKVDYDYIIIGAGAAGLMLANALGKDPFFSDKRVLLIDRDPKNLNDRTWCYWEKGVGKFDSIVHHNWDNIFFGGQEFSKQLDIRPYSYKLIRAIDFYRFFIEKINSYHNIDFVQGEVVDLEERVAKIMVTTKETFYCCNKVFKSSYDIEKLKNQRKYPLLHQHFIGWVVKTKKNVFNPKVATFMDFSIEQKNNTRFMYVLPFSQNEALVEYTLFSENLLPKAEYENAIKDYLINKLGVNEYEIIEREKGSIPMTCYKFHEQNTKGIMHIGTAGGWTKPSTGYTFYNSAKNTETLIQSLKGDLKPRILKRKMKYWFYDLLLLDILYKENAKGQYIFETLFRNRNPQLIFKFLDEETSFWEDLRIIAACPKKEFITALFQRIVN